MQHKPCYCTSCHSEKYPGQMKTEDGCIDCHEKRVLTGKISLLAWKFSGTAADVRPMKIDPQVQQRVRRVLA